MKQLDGKVAIVTGGGRGIGRANALALAAQGAAVLINDLGAEFSGEGEASATPAEEVAAEIEAAGGRAAIDTHDVSDWDAAGDVVEAVLAAFGRLDILVNNAGIARFASIDATTRLDWERTIAVNLTGTASVTHWAAAHWRDAGPEAGRRIVNTSSGVAFAGAPAGNPQYAAAKAGVAAMTIMIASELAPHGVRVNGIAPVARSRISLTVAPPLMAPVAEGFDRMAPENVAPVVTYLASPACRFTGRFFGIIGDDLTLFSGWTVDQHWTNGDAAWTLDALEQTLAAVPAQHAHRQQAIVGIDEGVMPSQEVLDALAAVERA